jgi:hypothetical protein
VRLLRVLQPNDPDSYYAGRELVPSDMLDDINRAKIVITNYHALKLRERIELSAGGRALLQGRGEELNTRETEGQMLQRVMPDLMGMKNILVLNDEAHHCYREKPKDADDEDLEALFKEVVGDTVRRSSTKALQRLLGDRRTAAGLDPSPGGQGKVANSKRPGTLVAPMGISRVWGGGIDCHQSTHHFPVTTPL